MTAESTSSPSHHHSNNAAGIVAMLFSQALFVSNDALTKLATGALPASEIMALRGAAATVIVALFTHRAGVLFRRGPYRNWRVLVRSVLDAAISATYIIALPHIPLPTIVTILQATPLILVAAGALLGERVGWRRWLAVAVGFAGVVIVVRPTAGPLGFVWLAAVTAVLMAARDIVTRRIHAEVPSSMVTLMTCAIVGLFGFAGAAVQTWHQVDVMNGLYLVGAAVLLAAGNHMLIRSLRLGEISVVSPYRYSAIVWATLLGIAIWRVMPDIWTFAGTALIVAAGIYTFHREARLRRARA